MKKKAKRIASLITVLSTLASAQAVNVIAAENIGYQDDTSRGIYCINNLNNKDLSLTDNNYVEDEYDSIIRDSIAKTYDQYAELGWAGYDGQANNYENDHKKSIYFVNGSSARTSNKTETKTYNGRIKMGINTYNSVNTAKAYDTVAHEYTHLVTESKLEWNGCVNGETFCLLEAYSDIMGELFDDNCDWKIGADIFDHMGQSLRDIAHPECTEHPLTDDKNYDNNFFVDYDALREYLKNNNSESANSGSGVVSGATRGAMVISHAAYLMNVNGISRDDLKKLWYRSMDTMKDITKETRYATFSDCRKAVVAAADIFSGFKKQRYLNIINAAFDNANVYIDGDVNDDGITDTKDIAVLTAYFSGSSSVLDTNRKTRSADVNHDGHITSADLDALKNEVLTSATQETLGDQSAMDSFIKKEKEVFPDNNMWAIDVDGPTDSARSTAMTPRLTEANYITINSTFFDGYDPAFDTASKEPYYECAGFAKRLQYDYFGTTKYLQLHDSKNYQPRIGDHLRVDDGSGKIDPITGKNEGTHSIFITSVDGDSFTYVDCNGAGNNNYFYSIEKEKKKHLCVIKWEQSGSIIRDGSGKITGISFGRHLPDFFVSVERPLMAGDVNGDSNVDYSDIYALWDMITNDRDTDDLGARYRFIAADLDQNGIIDSNDSNLLSNAVYSGSIDFGYIK